jgi:hypothetical protein
MFNDPCLPLKIWSRIYIIPQTNCWLWTGPINRDGYGSVHFNQKQQQIHRVFYETFKGPILKGTEIDHLCRVRNCCNPDHLETVSHQKNVDRSNGRKGSLKRTHCINGHPYTPENTYRSPQGVRACKICRAIKMTESRQRNIEKVRERDRLYKAKKYQENGEAVRRSIREYQIRNREKVRKRMQAYYQTNKEKWAKYK